MSLYKAGNTATLVASRWAGAVSRRSLGHLDSSSELKTLQDEEKVIRGLPNQLTN